MNKTQKIARRTAAAAELTTAMGAGDMDAVTRLTAEMDTLSAEITAIEAAERTVAAAQAVPAAAPAPDAPATPATRLSMGEQVARSDAFTGFNGAGRTERFVITTRAIDAGDLADGAGQVLAPLSQPRRQGLIPTLDRPLRVRDLFDNQQTDEMGGEYVVEVPPANAVGWVAQGAAKPKQDFAFETRSSTLKTVAGHAVLTRQAIRSPARIAGTVNGRLAYNLEEKIDTALISGDGVNAPLGLLNVVGRNLQAGPAGTATDGAKIISTIRKGLTQTLTNGKVAADAILMHPEDWETAELARANGADGIFLLTPNLRDGDGNARLWGKPIVETTGITKGKSVASAFKQSTVWQRDQINFYATDSHEGFFLDNKVLLLAETEISAEYYRPSVTTEITFTA